MVNNKTYFDNLGELYGKIYKNDDDFFTNWIKNKNDTYDSVLDIGSGGSAFGNNLSKINNNSNIVLLDISLSMVSKSDLANLSFVQGMIQKTPFKSNTFDIIHISRLIHHLVGNSHKDSKKIAENSISEIDELLKGGGLLLINEPYYDSYISNLASSIIFYTLKLASILNVRLPVKSYNKNLVVHFYSSKMLINMINEAGLVQIYKRKYSWNNCGLVEKICLIKDRGDLILILQKLK